MTCESTCLNCDVCKWVGCIYKHPLVNSSNVALFEVGNLTQAMAVSIFESIEPTAKQRKKMQNDNEWPEPEKTARFDWSLSYAAMEKKYLPKSEQKAKATLLQQHSSLQANKSTLTFDWEEGIYMPKKPEWKYGFLLNTDTMEHSEWILGNSRFSRNYIYCANRYDLENQVNKQKKLKNAIVKKRPPEIAVDEAEKLRKAIGAGFLERYRTEKQVYFHCE